MMRHEPSRTLYNPLSSPLRGNSLVESRFDESQSGRSTIRSAVVRSSFSSSLDADLRSRTEYNYNPICLRRVLRSVPRSPSATALFCRRSRLRRFSFIESPSSGSPNSSRSLSSTAFEIISSSSFLLIWATVLDILSLLCLNILTYVDSFKRFARAARTHNSWYHDARLLYTMDLAPCRAHYGTSYKVARHGVLATDVICHCGRWRRTLVAIVSDVCYHFVREGVIYESQSSTTIPHQ